MFTWTKYKIDFPVARATELPAFKEAHYFPAMSDRLAPRGSLDECWVSPEKRTEIDKLSVLKNVKPMRDFQASTLLSPFLYITSKRVSLYGQTYRLSNLC